MAKPHRCPLCRGELRGQWDAFFHTLSGGLVCIWVLLRERFRR